MTLIVETIPLIQLQIPSAILFVAGLATVLMRRNLFFVLMGVELMLNAANLSFLAWSRVQSGASTMEGQVAPVLHRGSPRPKPAWVWRCSWVVFRSRESLDTDAYSRMKE